MRYDGFVAATRFKGSFRLRAELARDLEEYRTEEVGGSWLEYCVLCGSYVNMLL